MEIISLTIKSSIKKSIDHVRGDIPRSRYINNILEGFVKESRDKNLSPSNNVENKYQKKRKVKGGEKI
jgi:hypothetical protein